MSSRLTQTDRFVMFSLCTFPTICTVNGSSCSLPFDTYLCFGHPHRNDRDIMSLDPGPPSSLPTDPDTRIDISRLTWEDKERVLRLLFAKINNVQVTMNSYISVHLLYLFCCVVSCRALRLYPHTIVISFAATCMRQAFESPLDTFTIFHVCFC